MMKGLILAGGEGTRLRPFTFSIPKHLIPLLGRAMIEYPIQHLVEAGVRDIGVVTGYLGHMIEEFLGDGSRYGARFTYVRQEKRLGIAHAIRLAIECGFIDREFIVYLGDNIVEHGVAKYVEEFRSGEFDVYILLTKTRDPSRFGVTVIRDGRVVKLVEKPREPISDLAVIGVYMFRDPDLVEKAFSSLKPSWRGEYEITELIQWFIDRGYSIGYSFVEGWWKDVGTPESFLEAMYFLLDGVKPRVEGDVHGEIVGRVVVEKGAVVEGKVYGPAYIGRGTYVSRKSDVEHYVSLEEGSRIMSGSISRSLVLNSAVLDLNKLRLIDSIIGRNSAVKCSRELHGSIRLVISDFSGVEL